MTPLSPELGSTRWQPGTIAEHRSELSRFLDEVALHPMLRAVAQASLDLMALGPGQAALEVGCGNGVFLPLLAAAVGPSGCIVGIDHSEAFVAEASARMARASLGDRVAVQLADAGRLPFPDASFDVAHCERVLMHLDDPSAGLAEMKRVVRPGGQVVAVEPDWAGYRIDHVDRKGMDLLYAEAPSSRRPDVGLTLVRRMADLDLVDIRPLPLTGATTDLRLVHAIGLPQLGPVADRVVAAGGLTRERADAILAGIESAAATGRFYCTMTMHLVAGRVPG